MPLTDGCPKTFVSPLDMSYLLVAAAVAFSEFGKKALIFSICGFQLLNNHFCRWMIFITSRGGIHETNNSCCSSFFSALWNFCQRRSDDINPRFVGFHFLSEAPPWLISFRQKVGAVSLTTWRRMSWRPFISLHWFIGISSSFFLIIWFATVESCCCCGPFCG